MQISLPKTEITLFSQDNIENQEPVVTIDNLVLQYNKNPKLLGVHLDEKPNFKKHIEIISHKASRCLGVLREINGIAKLSSKKTYPAVFWSCCRATAPKSAAPEITFPFPDLQRGVIPYFFRSIICKLYY